MKEICSKSDLAIVLSFLKGFKSPKQAAEQYSTEPEIAADMLWHMKMRGEIDGKTIADLGCGTGILGLGALLLGAKKAFLVDKDKEAISQAEENLKMLENEGYALGEAVLILGDISLFSENADAAVQNPPFGTKNEHADKRFLAKAFSTADIVYSFHKSSTDRFVRAFSDDKGFRVAEKADYAFPLKQTMGHHKRKVHRIEASLYRLEKKC